MEHKEQDNHNNLSNNELIYAPYGTMTDATDAAEATNEALEENILPKSELPKSVVYLVRWIYIISVYYELSVYFGKYSLKV